MYTDCYVSGLYSKSSKPIGCYTLGTNTAKSKGLNITLSVCAVQPCTYFQHTNKVNWLHSIYALLCVVL